MACTLNYNLINNDTEYEVAGYTGEPIDVVIPSSYNGKPVTSIRSGVFADRSNLTSVVIGDSVATIGEYAFLCCPSLTSVVIGDSVTTIGSYAFNSCNSLTSVVIPNSVTSIGNNSFSACSNLTKVTLLAKTPASLLNASVFENNPTFYCFNDAITAYKTASNWNTYANNFVADDMRLYFTMNSRAQKNYFASKEWVNAQSFGTAIQIITWEEND